MRVRGRWLASLVCAALVAVIGLTGCAFLGEPTSAETLLVRYAANPNVENYATDAKVNLAVSVSGFRANIPVTAKFVGAGKESYGTVDVDLSKLGAGVQSSEVYSELVGKSLKIYSRPAGDSSQLWERTEVDFSFTVDIPLVVDLLSDAKFMRVAYDSDDQICYELKLPAAKLVKSVLDMGQITTSFGDIDEDFIMEALGDSQLHVCFNEDCLMRSVRLDTNFTYRDKDVIALPVKVGLSLNAEMDGYGTIDPDEVAVPSVVRDGSKLEDEPLHLDVLADDLMNSAG